MILAGYSKAYLYWKANSSQLELAVVTE